MNRSQEVLLFASVAICLQACVLNKQFLKPTKVSSDLKTMQLNMPDDTIKVNFGPVCFEPTFLKLNGDKIDLSFNVESVCFRSSNGNMLNGWLLKPKTIVPSVTILLFHSNADFLLGHSLAMMPFVARGYQVFVFDYSGFGFSEGKATRKNLLIDGSAALTYVRGRADVRNTRLVLYGQSIGGHLSAVIASQRETDIDGLVIEGAFSSHKDIAAKTAGFLGRLLVKEQYSALRSIPSYHKPVLIIHSTEDETIPFKMGKKLFDKANDPKSFYEIDKCHICGPSYYADSISNKIMRMVDTDQKPL